MNKLVYFLWIPFIYSCSGDSQPNPTVALDGKQLMVNQCYSCHNTQGTDNMLAPPMFRVKDHYLDDGITEDEFVEAIVKWVKNPNEADSRMPGARRKFGLMPKQVFKEDEIRAIAKYLFSDDLSGSSCHSD